MKIIGLKDHEDTLVSFWGGLALAGLNLDFDLFTLWPQCAANLGNYDLGAPPVIEILHRISERNHPIIAKISWCPDWSSASCSLADSNEATHSTNQSAGIVYASFL